MQTLEMYLISQYATLHVLRITKLTLDLKPNFAQGREDS
jgi:hypothetical protein